MTGTQTQEQPEQPEQGRSADLPDDATRDRVVLDDAVLAMDDVTKAYGHGTARVDALRGVSLVVRPGELVSVMGPSGAGKSTLLHLAGGLDTPTSGVIEVEGTDVASHSRAELAMLRRRFVGYVFQDFNLIPSLTGAENVALPRELDGVSTRKARSEALDLLAEVGVAEAAGRFPDDMSGGQQQLVAIARALVGNRRLVLADEPTGALDSETGEQVLRVLRARIDAGAAGLLVTHEPRYAGWADRTVFLRDGLAVDDTEQPLGSLSILEARR
jgi:putative ABC transport system ATP-binding protein